jgi:hypothetical protein
MDKYRLVEEKFIGAEDFMDSTTDVAGHGSYRSSNTTREWSESHSHAAMIHRDDDDGTTTTNHDGRDDQQPNPNPNIVRITQQAKPRNCITAAMNMLVSSDELSDEGRFAACLSASCLPACPPLACFLSTFSRPYASLFIRHLLSHTRNILFYNIYTSNCGHPSHTHTHVYMYIYII